MSILAKKISGCLLLILLLTAAMHYSPYVLLSFDIKSEDNHGIKFYYYTGDDTKPYDEMHKIYREFATGGEFRHINVLLPRKSVDRLRMDFNGNKGEFLIKNMRVYNELWKFAGVSSDDFGKSYNNRQNLIVRNVNDGVSIILQANKAFLYSDKLIFQSHYNKTSIILLLLCLGCVFSKNCSYKTEIKLRRGKDGFLDAQLAFLGEWDKFRCFYRENYCIVLWLIVTLLFAYGFKVYNYTLSIDSEIGMFIPNLDGWTAQGRFGVAFIKSAVGNNHLIPYVSNFLAVLTLGMAALLFNYIYSSILPRQELLGWLGTAFVCLFVSYPASAEYMNFSTYNFEVALGQLFCAMAIYLQSRWSFGEGNRWYFIYGSILMILAFSIYQAIVPLYIVGCCMYWLLAEYCYPARADNRLVGGKYLAGLFMGLAGYFIINKLIMMYVPATDYLAGFIGWQQLDAAAVINNLVLYSYDIFTGNLVYRGGYFGIAAVCLLALALDNLIISKRNFYRAVLLLIIVAAPMLLPIVVGGSIPLRSQLVMALVAAFSACVAWQLCRRVIFYKKIIVMVLIVVAGYQAWGTATLFYGEYVKSQWDIALARQLAFRIESVKQDKSAAKLVFFLGRYQPNFHYNAVRQQDMLGKSFFDSNESDRINLFLLALGYGNVLPTLSLDEIISFAPEQYDQIKNTARSMPAWPAEGCVLEKPDFIIVKLSNDF